jgi:hypothetical protein
MAALTWRVERKVKKKQIPRYARDDILRGYRRSGRVASTEGIGRRRAWEKLAGLKSAASLSFLVDKDGVNCGHEDSPTA